VRHSIRRGLVLAALAGTALTAAAPAAFAETTSPEAFAVQGTGPLGIAPTPDATLANPNPANVATLAIPGIINLGTLSASVTSNTATSTVANINTTGILTPLLGVFTASAITSSCLAQSDGTFVLTTTIANLTIGATTLPAGPIAPNTNFLTIPLVASIVLNEQQTGPITGSQEVNAIQIKLVGGTEVIDVADSTCGPFTAATPIASGKGLVLGLGLLGSVGIGYGAVYTRRRRTAVI
jgi:hypothetical protein